MSGFDLILRGGMLVTTAGLVRADLGVVEGVIAAIEPELSGSVRQEIRAEGLHIFPGLIDAHVHFNEPGRADWEGLETGSRALAAGGGTLFFDMPLNAHPPTIDAKAFQQKRLAAEAKSLVDFALWGGLVPGNVERLPELAECGVVGFKAFMADSGMEDFLRVDEATLREGMKCAAQVGLPVAVHAESETMTKQLSQARIAAGNTGIRDYLESRPVEAELEAIRVAVDLAGETGCALHVVHVSCGKGIELVTQARRRGVDISAETCPHYLALTEADMERIGPLAKCAPPLRNANEQAELWQRLLAGEVTTIGSDHSPSPPEMKHAASFFKVWGGISGGQHTLSLLLTKGHFGRGLRLEQAAAMLSANVARRFNLPHGKGSIAEGNDADLVLVDLGASFQVTKDELCYRHHLSPYVGRRLRGRVVRTLLRGRTVFCSGKCESNAAGRFVRPVIDRKSASPEPPN